MIKTFFHYTPNLTKIKKSGFIKDLSFARTNTFDIILEVCPELVLSKKEVEKFNDIKKGSRYKIKTYESKYKGLNLKYKNDLLDEFFNQNKYVLAFDEKWPRGWITWGMLPLLINHIGKDFLKFKINNEIAQKSFVLEQKYWSPLYSQKRFGINTWDHQFKIEKHPQIVKDVFGKYYLSIKRVSDYKKGEFEVPEFWICGKISVKDCKIGIISKRDFNRLLKERERLRSHSFNE